MNHPVHPCHGVAAPLETQMNGVSRLVIPTVSSTIVIVPVVDGMVIASEVCQNVGRRGWNTRRGSLSDCAESQTSRRKRLANCMVHNGPLLSLLAFSRVSPALTLFRGI